MIPPLNTVRSYLALSTSRRTRGAAPPGRYPGRSARPASRWRGPLTPLVRAGPGDGRTAPDDVDVWMEMRHMAVASQPARVVIPWPVRGKDPQYPEQARVLRPSRLPACGRLLIVAC